MGDLGVKHEMAKEKQFSDNNLWALTTKAKCGRVLNEIWWAVWGWKKGN